jgi:thioredoxin-related protein
MKWMLPGFVLMAVSLGIVACVRGDVFLFGSNSLAKETTRPLSQDEIALLPSSAAEVEWRTDYRKARQEAVEKSRPLVIAFMSENSFYCKKLDRLTFRDVGITAQLNQQCIPLRIDPVKDRDLAESLRLQTYPTLVYASPDGRILGNQEGVVDAAFMKEQLDRIIAMTATRSLLQPIREETRVRFVQTTPIAEVREPEQIMTPVHVNTRSLKIHYEVTEKGRSDVVMIQVWATQDAKSWKKVCQEAPQTSSYVNVTVDKEGLWGFKLIARSGVGRGESEPVAGQQPDFWAEVDETAPEVAILSTEMSGDARNPRMTIRWRAQDKHLADRPISISYSTPTQSMPWTQLAAGLANDGVFVWNIPPQVSFHSCQVRVEAVDQAGNVGSAKTSNPVIVELAIPKVHIKTIEAGLDSEKAEGFRTNLLRQVSGAVSYPSPTVMAVPVASPNETPAPTPPAFQPFSVSPAQPAPLLAPAIAPIAPGDPRQNQ